MSDATINSNAGEDALARLRAGNLRFVEGVRRADTSLDRNRRAELVAGQAPFAIVLGCSDSRVPVEMVFDQGLGDLFVIRVAGNVVASSQMGSIEFAVDQFNPGLVLVLGHSQCGAIKATLSELQQPREARSDSVGTIVDRIRPAVQTLLETELARDEATLLHHAVRANVRAAVNQLKHGSALLEQRIESGRLLVIGAEYALDTGVVDFFEGVPPGSLG
ncbi:MAG: carbonic anhydrase [Pseudomonadota bacterium]